MKLLTIILATLFLFTGCGESSTPNNPDEETPDEQREGQLDLGLITPNGEEDPNANIQEIAEEIVNNESIVNRVENIPSITCMNSDGSGDPIVYRFLEGEFTCNSNVNNPEISCICEVTANDAVISYARNDQNWCRNSRQTILDGLSLSYAGGSYELHLGMECSSE